MAAVKQVWPTREQSIYARFRRFIDIQSDKSKSRQLHGQPQQTLHSGSIQSWSDARKACGQVEARVERIYCVHNAFLVHKLLSCLLVTTAQSIASSLGAVRSVFTAVFLYRLRVASCERQSFNDRQNLEPRGT